jgi:glycosyltransferase involved in cell wall biosynthesis
LHAVRICLVYDCLYPHTVGGAERWYRSLASRLAAEGHEVTYLTLRQWARGFDASYDGVRVRTAGPRMALYTGDRRRILPPLVFGAGVFWHLLRHGRRYDVVHTSSFPYFSLLAAAVMRPFAGFRLVVDWVEVWSREYWREYLGALGGRLGEFIQRLCIRVPQRAFCYSRLHRDRLVASGLRGEATVIDGLYAGGPAVAPRPAEPVVVFAGRHIREKQPTALVAAMARVDGLRAVIFGDGPERSRVLAAIAEHGLADRVEAPGFVDGELVHDTLGRALCLVLPSQREGYGLVVVEAAARGVPSVVVAHPDNAAVELVEDGVNGVVASSGDPATLAAAIERVRAAGPDMRTTTAAWFARNERRLSLDASLDRVVDAYGSVLHVSA